MAMLGANSLSAIDKAMLNLMTVRVKFGLEPMDLVAEETVQALPPAVVAPVANTGKVMEIKAAHNMDEGLDAEYEMMSQVAVFEARQIYVQVEGDAPTGGGNNRSAVELPHKKHRE